MLHHVSLNISTLQNNNRFHVSLIASFNAEIFASFLLLELLLTQGGEREKVGWRLGKSRKYGLPIDLSVNVDRSHTNFHQMLHIKLL